MAQFFCLLYFFFLHLPFRCKGSKVLNGGSEMQDTTQSQHNGDNTDENKDKPEVGSKKK